MNYKRTTLLFIVLTMMLSLGIMQTTAAPGDLVVQVNFQALGDPVTPPAGYLADGGEAYGPRGNGFDYGWVIETTTSPINYITEGRNRGTPADVRLATLMHMQRAGVPQAGAWEIALPNGNYEVTVSAGDGANTDSIHRLNVEGRIAVNNFIPFGGNLFDEQTVEVNVNDGRLTIDAIGGTNTKINYVIIREGPATLNPSVLGTSPMNGATNVDVNSSISTAGLYLPNSAVDGDTITPTTVYLYPTGGNPATDVVPVTSVNTTGGGDAITLTPAVPLNANTNYTFVITDGVQDLAGMPFIPFNSTFTTGAATTGGGSTISFTRVTNLGVPTNDFGYMSLDVWNGRLYALTGAGIIYHWAINPVDGTLTDQRQIMALAGRIAIGLDFEDGAPANAPVMWVSHNAVPMINAGHFTGAISRLQGVNVGQGGENWIREDYVTGLPRSTNDHLTNSLQFGPDGALYVLQGSISAMGARSPQSWGNQPETLLSAALLRVDIGILNGMTRPVNVATGIPNTPIDLPDATNFGFGDPGLAANGLYDPQAPGAPVTVYASGIRNAYDLVWHSNGRAYVPANGSAGGNNDAGGTARIPQMPANFATLPQCQNRVDDGIYGDFDAGEPFVANNHNAPDTQPDYLFVVDPAQPNGYFGHPNPTRCEWIMNGGNPSPIPDQGQVGNHYPVGTLPDRNWRGIAYDFDNNKSPNGVIEYQNTTNFGGQLAGSLIVTRWSQNDDLIVLTPGGPTGSIVSAQTGIAGFTGLANPLDITEDPATGNIYVAEFVTDNGQGSRITMLRANDITGIPNIVLNPESLMVFSDIENGGTSPTQNLTISNTGDDDLIIGQLLEIGLNPDQFNETFPAVPVTVPAGGSIQIPINFAPTTTGLQVANIRIDSNDPDTPIEIIELRGLATPGEGGQNEPSLQAILNAFGIPVTVGDPNVATTPLGNGEAVGDYPGPLTGQEVAMQTFSAADPGQPVTFEVLAAYGIDGTPPIQFGWHPIGDGGNLNQLFQVDPGQHQTLSPGTTGTLQFTPGTDSFALYSRYPSAPWNGRVVSTQDSINAVWDNNITHKARVYPLRDGAGIVPDAYIIAYEEWVQGWDYNDIVVIARNLAPANSAVGGQIRFENLDWVEMFANATVPDLEYLNRWMTFNRINTLDPVNGGVMDTHDQVTMRIHNDDPTEALQITGFTISDPTEYAFPNGENPTPGAPIIVPAGGFYDLVVDFIEPNGGGTGTRMRTLTVNSTDATEPVAELTLAGGWMPLSDGINELIVPQIFEVFGFTNNTAWPFDSQYVARGEEILAPAWTTANPAESVYVRQIGAWHGCCVATEDLQIGGPGGGMIEHNQNYAQSLLPNSDADITEPTEGVFNPTANFQIVVNNNPSNQGVGQPARHATRLWPLRNVDGNIVPNAYMVMYDYIPGGGCVYTPGPGLCDYNDNMYIITNIEPVGAITDMDIDIAATPLSVAPDADTTVTVTAENITIFTADDVEVEITLPAAISDDVVSITTPVGTCAQAGNVITCDLGDINGDISVPIDIVINSADIGTYDIDAALTTTSPENSTDNNDATVALVVLDPADLPGSITIVKDATPASNQEFSFTIDGGLTPGSFILVDDGSPAVAPYEAAFNFQLGGAPVPDGYAADIGEAYSAIRGYGWVVEGTTTPIDGTGEARDRNRGVEQRLDTIMHMQRDAGVGDISWIADVPNGTYEVTLSVGDGPNGSGIYDSTHNVNVNGVNAINLFVPNAVDEYLEATVTVTVTDGRLVVDAIGGTNTKINYIEISQQVGPSSIRTFNNVTPGTYNITEALPSGWLLTDATCDGTFVSTTNSVSVTVGANEDITCTFENALSNGPVVSLDKTPDTQEVDNGATATFTLAVSNIGTVNLTNIAVTDPLCTAGPTYVGGDNGDGIMQPGEVWFATCEVANVTAPFTNTASVSATAPDSTIVGDTDTAQVTLTTTSAVTITKDADQTVNFGDTANFTITVTNTGVGALSNVVVTDALVPACDATFATIAEGASETYACALDDVVTTFTNTAIVTATGADNADVSASDIAVVTVPPAPSFTVDLTADQTFITPGETATFTLTVTNDGNVPFVSGSIDTAVCTFTYVSGDDGNTAIDPGETHVFTCEIPNATSTITNDVIVSLIDSNNVTTTGTGTATVVVVTTNAPAIDITKGDDQLINSGDDATFTITVTNIGNADLTNVIVTDATTPACDATFATLAIGASETYTCTATAVTASFTNTADVVGTAPDTSLVNDSDSAEVTVFLATPSITIIKTAVSPTVEYGGTAVFDISVQNNGNVALTNVGLVDPLVPSCNATIGTLAIGEIATGQCTLDGVTADFTNTATVTATTPTSAIIDDTDTADIVVVINGGVNIEKTPETQTIQSGDTVTFTLTVTNTGNSPLPGVTVTDPICTTGPTLTGGDTNGDNILQTTEAWTYTCDVADVFADFTNTATVEATALDTTLVTDDDTATVTVNSAPGVSISQTPNVQTVTIDGTASFEITVENTGDVPMSNVVVTGTTCTEGPTISNGDANGDGILQVDETWTFLCNVANVTTPFTNTVDLSADDPAGNTFTDSSNAGVSIDTVNAPAIGMSMSPAVQTVQSGGSVTLVMEIGNFGAVDLLNVAVTNDQCLVAPVLTGGDANGDGILQNTEIWAYACDVNNITTALTSTANVTADDGAGTIVNASDVSVISVDGVASPVIAIDKAPTVQTVASGATANFTIIVGNFGTVDLLNVNVTDAQCDAAPVLTGGDANGDGILQTTESWTYTCATANVTQPFTNTADVTADDGTGNVVNASDSAFVIVDGVVGNVPAIDIIVSPEAQTVVAGQPAGFTLAVYNSGNADLTNVVITDNMSPTYANCATTFAVLAVGGFETWECNTTPTTLGADFTAIFSVVGTDATTNVEVTDTVSAAVTVVEGAPDGGQPPVTGDPGGTPGDQPVTNPGDQQFSAFDPFVTKIADPPFAIPGEAVTFTFYVSNPGDVPAQNVVAIDPIPAEVEILSADAPSGTITISGQDVIFSADVLQPGETITVTIETRVRDNVATPFTIINEVCMNADNMPQQSCDSASVISISTLPATGETPVWSLILRGILAFAGVVIVTAGAGLAGRRLLNTSRA